MFEGEAGSSWIFVAFVLKVLFLVFFHFIPLFCHNFDYI